MLSKTTDSASSGTGKAKEGKSHRKTRAKLVSIPLGPGTLAHNINLFLSSKGTSSTSGIRVEFQAVHLAEMGHLMVKPIHNFPWKET